MKKTIDSDFLEAKAILFGSLLKFTQLAFKKRTGREFVVLNEGASRESHYISICRALTKVLRGQTKRLIIQIPPRYGKTELIIHFVAWAIAHYPDSNFIYASYASTIAKDQTQTIREIISSGWYNSFFDVRLSQDTTAKDNFRTTSGGKVFAVGANGSITGRGAGIANCDRFGGAILIDDIHKPQEVFSDTIRSKTNNWFSSTLMSRVNSRDTPIILIGQSLHEDDLPENLKRSGEWEILVLKALDDAGQPLCIQKHTKNELLAMQEKYPYEFSAQYQQSPMPAGGGIFKEKWFTFFDEMPNFIQTFLTIDTAETDKSYNDATVFSFWGVHKTKAFGRETEELSIAWLDCCEVRIEPKDLENELEEFYRTCMSFKVPPSFIAIEKKSTGVTLSSILSTRRGIVVKNISRTSASGSKTARYIEIQPYVAQKLISFHRHAKHSQMCIEHCAKITANNTHRHDDICDTLYDAVKIALIDKISNLSQNISSSSDETISIITKLQNQQRKLRRQYV